jgi:F-type H+-transporting ATPase subunit delta
MSAAAPSPASVAVQGRTVDPAARRYAEALLEAADARGGTALLQEVGATLSRAAGEWRGRRSIGLYFLSPRVGGEQKARTIEALAGGRWPPIVRDFVLLLLRRKRLIHLPAIADAFAALLDRRLGRMPVTLATAVPMPAEGIARWTASLRAALGVGPVVRHVVRPDLIAGAVVVAGDVVADGSARRALEELRRRIIETGHRERATHAPSA